MRRRASGVRLGRCGGDAPARRGPPRQRRARRQGKAFPRPIPVWCACSAPTSGSYPPALRPRHALATASVPIRGSAAPVASAMDQAPPAALPIDCGHDANSDHRNPTRSGGCDRAECWRVNLPTIVLRPASGARRDYPAMKEHLGPDHNRRCAILRGHVPNRPTDWKATLKVSPRISVKAWT